MNAVELMVGDWADYGDGQPRRTSPADIFDCSDCEPIPITDEILEKNGFHNVWQLKGMSIMGDDFLTYESERAFLFIEVGRRDTKYLDAEGIYYVHQLQQAIRLIGCKKEIEL